MSDEITSAHINSNFVVLEEDGSATTIAVSDHFYEDLEQKLGDFQGLRLISHYTFDQDWDSWERHPAGDEFVCLLFGQVNLILKQNGTERSVSLHTPDAYVRQPRCCK